MPFACGAKDLMCLVYMGQDTRVGGARSCDAGEGGGVWRAQRARGLAEVTALLGTPSACVIHLVASPVKGWCPVAAATGRRGSADGRARVAGTLAQRSCGGRRGLAEGRSHCNFAHVAVSFIKGGSGRARRNGNCIGD
jgi:hypothetical protein